MYLVNHNKDRKASLDCKLEETGTKEMYLVNHKKDRKASLDCKPNRSLNFYLLTKEITK